MGGELEFPLSESATAQAIRYAMQSPDCEVEREGGEDQAEPQPSTSGASADPEVLAGHLAAAVVEVTKPRQVFLSHCWSDFAEDDTYFPGILRADLNTSYCVLLRSQHPNCLREDMGEEAELPAYCALQVCHKIMRILIIISLRKL